MSGNATGDVIDKYAAAEYLQISVASVVRRAKEGAFGAKVGNLWRFRISELDEYYTAQRGKTANAPQDVNDETQTGNARTN